MGQTQSYPSNGAEPGKRYRDLANKDGDARREFSRKSQEGTPPHSQIAIPPPPPFIYSIRRTNMVPQTANKKPAWARNERAKAKEYSLAAKAHQLSMEHYNVLAAAEVFAARNPSYLRTPSQSLFGSLFGLFAKSPAPETALGSIDLHWLRVNEALEKVKEHLALCRRYGVERTTIITGRGLHSVDGVAKIRPQVERLLSEERVRVVREGRENEGAFVVELVKEGEAVEGWGEWVLRVFGSK